MKYVQTIQQGMNQQTAAVQSLIRSGFGGRSTARKTSSTKRRAKGSRKRKASMRSSTKRVKSSVARLKKGSAAAKAWMAKIRKKRKK